MTKPTKPEKKPKALPPVHGSTNSGDLMLQYFDRLDRPASPTAGEKARALANEAEVKAWLEANPTKSRLDAELEVALARKRRSGKPMDPLVAQMLRESRTKTQDYTFKERKPADPPQKRLRRSSKKKSTKR